MIISTFSAYLSLITGHTARRFPMLLHLVSMSLVFFGLLFCSYFIVFALFRSLSQWVLDSGIHLTCDLIDHNYLWISSVNRAEISIEISALAGIWTSVLSLGSPARNRAPTAHPLRLESIEYKQWLFGCLHVSCTAERRISINAFTIMPATCSFLIREHCIWCLLSSKRHLL